MEAVAVSANAVIFREVDLGDFSATIWGLLCTPDSSSVTNFIVDVRGLPRYIYAFGALCW